jgi:hypothetical protein
MRNSRRDWNRRRDPFAGAELRSSGTRIVPRTRRSPEAGMLLRGVRVVLGLSLVANQAAVAQAMKRQRGG